MSFARRPLTADPQGPAPAQRRGRGRSDLQTVRRRRDVFGVEPRYWRDAAIDTAQDVAGAEAKENAIRFLEYLTQDSAQAYFANGNNEYPAVAGVAPTSFVEGLGAFRADNLNTATIGSNQAKAVAIYDKAGWN